MSGVNDIDPVIELEVFKNNLKESSSIIQEEGSQGLDHTPPSIYTSISAEVLRDSSSKGSLCLEMGNLRVKSPVGRPKKISHKERNPFHFVNFGVKKGCKKVCSGRLKRGPTISANTGRKYNKLNTILESLGFSKDDQARGILNCANLIRLQVNMDMSTAVKEVSRVLEKGTL